MVQKSLLVSKPGKAYLVFQSYHSSASGSEEVYQVAFSEKLGDDEDRLAQDDTDQLNQVLVT